MTVRQFIAVSSIIVGSMTALVAINSTYVLPAILRAAEKDTANLIREHEGRTHNGSATTADLKLMRTSIRDHETEVLKRLDRIEGRLMNGAHK